MPMNSVHSSPPKRRHTIVSSNARGFSRPRGFLGSVMRHHDMDDMDDNGIMMTFPQPETQISQDEQDALDEDTRKRAMRNLVSSWQERLQLISVISTFFASTEAALLVNTANDSLASNTLKASTAGLLGALILHVYASVLSFLGAFLLISYKLKEATREEMIAEGKLVNSPESESPFERSVIKDIERYPTNPRLRQTPADHHDAQSTTQKSVHNTTTTWAPGARNEARTVAPSVISTKPYIEQVGPFMTNVSSHLLSRTHALCVFLTAVGFVLAIVGILCYAWASQPTGVSIFASTCLGGAVLAMAILVIPASQ